MKRLGLGGLFFGWLYGVPFLLLVGLIRRMSRPYTPNADDAQAFGATTDALLTTGLLLNGVLPVLGLLLAGWAGEALWRRHFAWAFAGTVLLYVAVALVGSMATSSLIGHIPADLEPDPVVTQCIPISGGRSCPGG
ncbi:hypothetical protein AB0B39_16530 [Micromonospora sp. NPDC049114]|uniref:hypothetical protein n=1 Tax=Micromonospora sp. NPDC049114 TaxID=3155498 RepID=UPI0033CF1A1E